VETDMLEDLQAWWESASPDTQMAVYAGSAVLLGLLAGQFLAALVWRTLHRLNFDAALRLPRGSASVLAAPAEAEHGITPTLVAANLVRLTVWAIAIWWTVRLYGQAEFAQQVALIVSRVWALAGVLVAALTLGSMLARRLIACWQDVAPAGNAQQRGLAGAVGATAYVLVVLLCLLVAADLFDWPLTRNSAQALWRLAQNLLIAGTALFMGTLGARWARDSITPDSAASPEKRAGQYTALGIIAATTMLAVAVLLSGAGVLIGLAALGVVGFLLWLVRGYLPDIAAGLQLRAHRVREVHFDGQPWQLDEVGFLSTRLAKAGEFYRLQNRHVLEARLSGAPAHESAR
jgi:hypothetical protein